MSEFHWRNLQKDWIKLRLTGTLIAIYRPNVQNKFCYSNYLWYKILGQWVLQNVLNLLHLHKNVCSEAAFNLQLTNDSFSHAVGLLSQAMQAITCSISSSVLCSQGQFELACILFYRAGTCTGASGTQWQFVTRVLFSVQPSNRSKFNKKRTWSSTVHMMTNTSVNPDCLGVWLTQCNPNTNPPKHHGKVLQVFTNGYWR